MKHFKEIFTYNDNDESFEVGTIVYSANRSVAGHITEASGNYIIVLWYYPHSKESKYYLKTFFKWDENIGAWVLR